GCQRRERRRHLPRRQPRWPLCPFRQHRQDREAMATTRMTRAKSTNASPRTAARAKPNPLRKKRAQQITRVLAKEYPDAHCALHHENALQLLVATILSAQCTDVRVNMVTLALFQRYPDARAFANADPRELETAIQSTG